MVSPWRRRLDRALEMLEERLELAAAGVRRWRGRVVPAPSTMEFLDSWRNLIPKPGLYRGLDATQVAAFYGMPPGLGATPPPRAYRPYAVGVDVAQAEGEDPFVTAWGEPGSHQPAGSCMAGVCDVCRRLPIEGEFIPWTPAERAENVAMALERPRATTCTCGHHAADHARNGGGCLRFECDCPALRPVVVENGGHAPGG